MSHIHEKIDFTVDAFIVYKDKVLLRLHDKYNEWLAVGGHVELDEDPNQAVLREVKEEVGLDIVLWEGTMKKLPEVSSAYNYRELIPPVGMNIHNVSKTHQHLSMCFLASAKTDVVVPESPKDIWKWLSRTEVESMKELLPDIRFYALLALDTLGKIE